MANRAVVKAFKEPAWNSTQDVDAFLAGLDKLDKSDALKALDAIGKLASRLTKQRLGLCCMALIGIVQRAPSRDFFVPLVRSIKTTPHPLLIETVGHLLPVVNHPAEHKELSLLLVHEDARVRRAAGGLLEKVFAPGTIDVLAKIAASSRVKGTPELLDVTLKLAGPRGLGILLSLLGTGTPDVQRRVLKVLAEDPSLLQRDRAAAEKALIGAVDDPADEIATAAIEALASLDDEELFFREVGGILESFEVPRRTRSAVRALGRFRSARVIQVLDFRIAAGPGDLRIAALGALERIAHDDVLPPLVAAIGHEDLQVRSEAVRVLRALTAAGAVDIARTLLWLLRSPDVAIRRMAAEVVDAVKDPGADLWPRLIRFLRDEDWWVRERVLDALVQLAGDELTGHLVELLDDESATLRRLAVEGIGRLGDVKALGAAVRTARDDDDWWVREEAVRAIAKLNDERAVPYIIDLLVKDEDVAVAAIDALCELKAPGAVDDVVLFLQSDLPEVRLAALRYLELFGEPALGSMITPMAYDSDPDVGKLARKVLSDWSVKILLDDDASEHDPERALDLFLDDMNNRDGDDLVLLSGRKAYVKQRGQMIPVTEQPLTAEHVYMLLAPLLDGDRAASLATKSDVDFSHLSRATGLRFRVNVFQAQQGLGAVFRRIRSAVLDLEELGLPDAVQGFHKYRNGLVLVGGPPGSGKSTTLAALVSRINQREGRHIITVEDPIEAVHGSDRSLINQREIGTHTQSFGNALRSMLREDPDVILIGELRDLATIEFALRAAETGHLVFSTVHTFSADTTVDRMVSAHPPERRDQARGMLADSLKAVLCQFLLPDQTQPGGRAVAAEVMLQNDAISNVIRKGQAFQIPSLIQLSRQQGMQSMDDALGELYTQSRITSQDLYLRLRNKEAYERITGEPSPHKGQVPVEGAEEGQKWLG